MKRPLVVLTVDEYRVVKQLADSERVSVGTLVRRLIAKEALNRGLLPPVDHNNPQGVRTNEQQ